MQYTTHRLLLYFNTRLVCARGAPRDVTAYRSPLTVYASVMRLEADRLAIREILEIDVRALGRLVDRVLDLLVGLVGCADVEELERIFHFPFVRPRDARRRVDDRARADLELFAFEVAHGRVARNHVVARFDRVPVELLVSARLVSRAPEAHAIGLLDLGPTDEPLVGLTVGDAATSRTVFLVDDAQGRFDFDCHVLLLPSHSGAHASE